MNNYPYIPFVPDKSAVIRRLGSQRAAFGPHLEMELDEAIKKAESSFAARGRAEAYGLERVSEEAVAIAGITVKSRLLSKMLSQSTMAYVMCAAIPQNDVDKINKAMQRGDGLLALVLDAYASEYVDGALDVIIQRKNEALKRTGQRLTSKRFSAGYGDLEIKYQKDFYDLLGMQSLGVNINDRFLLTPEKSVIAVAGVE